MVIQNKLNTKKHLILAILCFLLNSTAILSMNSYPEDSRASCSYAPENSADQRFLLTPDTINDYLAQLKNCVQLAQKNPTPQALNTISDLYFYAQFTQDSDKETAREIISPVIDTLIARNNDQALSALAHIFVRTRHAPRINQFVQNMMAARNDSSAYAPLSATLSTHEQPAYRPTVRAIETNDTPTARELNAIEQEVSPSAPPYEQLSQDHDITAEIEQAGHNIEQLLALAQRHPAYASLINDTIAELALEIEEAQAPLNPHNQALQAPQEAAPAFIPEAPVIEPALNRNRLAAATVIGGGILGIYLWHRYTKNSR